MVPCTSAGCEHSIGFPLTFSTEGRLEKTQLESTLALLGLISISFRNKKVWRKQFILEVFSFSNKIYLKRKKQSEMSKMCLAYCEVKHITNAY
jgi:hypothetical protein